MDENCPIELKLSLTKEKEKIHRHQAKVVNCLEEELAGAQAREDVENY